MNPCAAILERHLAGELSYYECEYRMKHKDGYWVEIHDRGRIVTRKTEGKPLSMFGFHLDITERKQAEAKIFHLQKEESLGRMAGAVAHHYNNLIQIIAGNLELVQEKLPENSGSAGNLADAMHAARRASNMGGMMLAYLGHTVARHENLELSGTCRGFLSSFIANMPAHVTLAADLSKPGLIVNANAGHIRQILEILISNASESVKEQSGSVFLSIRKSASVDIPTDHRYPVDFLANPSDYACLEVRDTGEGILQKNLEKIFDPFYSTRFTGRGLGLPIVLGTIKTHQGCMTVATMPGKGSTFRVYLPLIREKQYDQY
jgi:signal transduction histidine kinase